MRKYGVISLLFVMLLLTASNSLCISFYIPAFQDLASYFHSSPESIQSSLTLFMLFLGIGQFIFGCLIEKIGVKFSVLYSLSMVFTGSVIIIFAKGIYIFMLGRCLQGIGSGGISVGTKSVLTSRFKSSTLPQAFSILMMGMTLVPLVVPVLGGYIAHYISWRAIFVVIALYSLSLFLIGFLYLDNDKRKYDNLSGFFLINFNKYLHVIKNRDFISIVIALVLIYSFQPIYLSTLPFLLKKLSPSEIGKLMAIPVFFELMSMLVVTFLNKILGDKLIIRCGLAAALLGITLLALSYGFNYNGAMYITFFMALTIFGGGLIFPNLLSKALKIHPESLSYASATLGILQQFGGAAILTMIGLLQIQSQIGLAFVLFLCLAAAGFFILKSRRTRNDKEFA